MGYGPIARRGARTESGEARRARPRLRALLGEIGLWLLALVFWVGSIPPTSSPGAVRPGTPHGATAAGGSFAPHALSPGAQAALMVGSMSLDDKLGQMMIFQFTDSVYTPEQAALVRPFHPGGVILYDYAMGSAQQVRDLLAAGQAALVLGFESYGGPVAAAADRALELCRDNALDVIEAGARGGSGDAWRSSFVRAPYVREQLILLGVLVETFETAITWDRFEDFVRRVSDAATDAVHRVCGEGTVTCRLTHVYPDGAAPYFTVMAPARRGSELAQWDEVKAAASEAVIAAGGTITHHHAVGRDHHRWYADQRPQPFAAALAAAKAAVDPAGVLNPGVIATVS